MFRIKPSKRTPYKKFTTKDLEPEEFYNMDLTTYRYPSRWSDEQWEKELEQHPMFMTKQPENGDIPPLVEAFQQLKYGEDDNTLEEVVISYKEEGNRFFKLGKYNRAIDCYTAGMFKRVESKWLNSILYSNRSAAHFYLKNYRSSLLDALKAVEFNPNNAKAIQKVIQSCLKLERYGELVKFCDNNQQNIPNVDQIRKEAEENFKIKERDRRKAEFEEQKRKDAIIAEENLILDELNKRGIKVRRGENFFDATHPAALCCNIELNEMDGSISFPVMFFYPEIEICDLIERVNENDQFYQHIVTSLEDENYLPVWNKVGMFNTKDVIVKFVNTEDDPVLVDKFQTLGQILKDPKTVINNILLTFAITTKEY